jgi:hypothetical protein
MDTFRASTAAAKSRGTRATMTSQYQAHASVGSTATHAARLVRSVWPSLTLSLNACMPLGVIESGMGAHSTHLPTSSTLVGTRRTASHTSCGPWTKGNVPEGRKSSGVMTGVRRHATTANTPWVVQLLLVSAALDGQESERGHAAHEHS